MRVMAKQIKSKTDESDPQTVLQSSPHGQGQLCFEYIYKEYLAKWLRNKKISAIFYTDAYKELEALKKTKYAKRFSKTTTDESETPSSLPDIESVRNLPSPPSFPNKERFTSQSHVASEHTSPKIEGTQTVGTKTHQSSNVEQRKSPKPKSQNHVQEQPNEVLHLKKDNEKLKRNLEAADKEIKEKQDNMIELQELLANSLAENNNLNEKNSLMRKRLQNAEASVQELTLRLSKLAGDNIRKGNPNLADLSDPYRPTELGKIFSEIYDNEWSDAYEKIENDENGRINVLYDVLMDCYKFCYTALENQQDTIDKCVMFPPLQEGEPAINFETDKLPREDKIHLAVKDVRKKYAAETAKQLAQVYIENQLVTTQDPSMSHTVPKELRSYGRKCTELCWLMVICDPPLAFSEFKNGDEFKSEVFRPYTRSQKDMKNPVIEMTVWPALYLHEGGPLLSKGVAQPISNKDFQKLKK